MLCSAFFFFFFQAEDGIRDVAVTGVQTCALPILRAEQAFLEGTRDLLDERALAWHRAAALLQLTERLPTAGRGDWRERAHALLGEATRLAERAAQPETMTPRQRAAVRVRAPALELGLQARSTRPATRGELDQIRALLREGHDPAS